MPFEEDVPDDVDQMIQQLQQCDPADLRRARRHHRRALEALRNGCYEALGEDTRNQLIGRLQTDLDALNHVLDGVKNQTRREELATAGAA